MKYTIEGFNQSVAMQLKKQVQRRDKTVTIKIDCTDLVILRWFVDFYPKMKKYIVNDKEYAWVSHKKLIQDLPLIDINRQSFIERMQKLVEFKILDYVLLKEQGNISAYTFGEVYEKLIDDGLVCSTEQDLICSNIQGVMCSNEQGLYVQPNNDKSIIDNNIKDINKNTYNQGETADEVWEKALIDISQNVSASGFSLFIKPLEPYKLVKDTLYLKGTNLVIDTASGHYSKFISDALEKQGYNVAFMKISTKT
jgi:hypothetical protein